jgi:hypothetical protein
MGQNYQPPQADDLFTAKLLKVMKSVGCPDPNLASESSYGINYYTYVNYVQHQTNI